MDTYASHRMQDIYKMLGALCAASSSWTAERSKKRGACRGRNRGGLLAEKCSSDAKGCPVHCNLTPCSVPARPSTRCCRWVQHQAHDNDAVRGRSCACACLSATHLGAVGHVIKLDGAVGGLQH